MSGYSIKSVAYYQLKHSTVRNEHPFRLSDLKKTIEGFAERFSAHLLENHPKSELTKIRFSIVSNRPILGHVKQNIYSIVQGNSVDSGFQETLERYTNLTGKELKNFCSTLEFADGVGDYSEQRYELHTEISQLLAGTVDNTQIDNIFALVQQKVLPNSDGRIVREEILKRFGVTSERALYPAPKEFEKLSDVLVREQYQELRNSILTIPNPIIIHAAGGVGKSVFAQQVVQSLPNASFGVVYDCFGGGRYRNRSESRHRHRDALVQIVNELASNGLCDPLVAQSSALENEIMISFLSRIEDASKSLRKMNEDALLVILIDAADNAEMAAKEFSESCFASELLREQLPNDCRLVALCRTERIHLLKPSNKIAQLSLIPFSAKETLLNLKNRYPEATEADGLEFHRLTGGNPRVQANALSIGSHQTVTETLINIGPYVTTVEDQIKAQLNSAISSVKDMITIDYQSRIDAICLSLANLPPLIPVSVLAIAAEVDEATVKSFVSDLGRPLWLSDTSVQFRDEPTETWFRENFSASVEQIDSYVSRLKPLAYKNSYVAEALPSLMLQAQQYDELIQLAISDKFLPNDNPIDQRNVRIYRLQFAFKAALKLERYDDAIKLALRAGEEVAGDKRQLELLTKNVDLITPLQKDRVQELAYRRLLRGEWAGSENVYSASLLSTNEEFRGEARGYLRAARNWLKLHFEEQRQNKYYAKRLEEEDIVELAYTYFNLFGIHDAVDFLLGWGPKYVIYNISKKFISRLIDLGDINAVHEMSKIDSRNQYLTIALASELLEVGKLPSVSSMEICLDLLANRRTSIQIPDYSYDNTINSSLVSFLESCSALKLPSRKIIRVLRRFFSDRASSTVHRDFYREDRSVFLRAVTLKYVLSGNLDTNLNDLLPEEFTQKDQKHKNDHQIREFKEVIGGLLPFYKLRARVLINEVDDIFIEVQEALQLSRNSRNQRWNSNDFVPYEISELNFDILMFYQSADQTQVTKFFTEQFEKERQLRISGFLKTVRAAYRLDHLRSIRQRIELATFDLIRSASKEGPETKANWYIDLARSVLPLSPDDASIYFDYAIEAVSKFGDEIVERWEAVSSLATRSLESNYECPELAYRFIRCAELVGDNVASEKYLDRDEAIRICTKLSPVTGMASLSRWRDRDVGWCYR